MRFHLFHESNMNGKWRAAVLLLATLFTGLPGDARAQASGAERTAANTEPARSAEGRLLVQAFAVERGVRIDGELDEAAWQNARPVSGFVQAEPRGGEPASERTEVRILYDEANLYIGAQLYDSDVRGIVVNDIRKDFRADDQDTFEVILDTYADRRNGYIFRTNAEGARADQQSANEGREINQSWDAVWFVKTRRTEDGWTVEMAIPFRALRFDESTVGERVWGVNFLRRIRRRNELDYWSPIPRAHTLSRVSLAGDLVGLPAASGGRDLRLKPFVVGRTIREPGASGFDEKASIGLDLKYGVTESLTLDLTARPDFAQAEADEQQVNLSQFSQFFPEKREFFLENSGIFYVGDAARNNRVFLSPTPDEDLLLFFSRRIGLNQRGQEIPILGGGRLTGRAGGWIIGALSVQTRGTELPPLPGATTPSTVDANNYSVLRVRRNLFAGSDAGALFMMRQSTEEGGDYNRVYGVDANIRIADVDWNSYLIRSATPAIDDGQYAVRTSLNREGNFFHGKGGFMAIGEGFNAEMGYYRRTAVHKWFTDIGIRPRPEALARRGIRELHPHIVWDYFTDLDGRMIGKRLHSGFSFFFSSGAFLELSYNPEFQHTNAPLVLRPGSPALPAGGYGWHDWTLRGQTDLSRPLSLSYAFTGGGLWSGTQRTVNFTGTIRPSYRLRTSIGMQRTDARLGDPVGDFVRTIWTTRANYSFNTNMFIDALAQYDPDQDRFNANVRFNLIHRPLSDLFIVYNEQRITGPDAPVPGRGVIVKVTRMVAF